MWVSVKDRLPKPEGLEKYRVKMVVGSMSPKVVESHVLGKAWHDTTHFMVGDWQKVTHWWDGI
jgi:hypothetical protein